MAIVDKRLNRSENEATHLTKKITHATQKTTERKGDWNVNRTTTERNTEEQNANRTTTESLHFVKIAIVSH